jgi:hypothetical protein
MLDRHIELDEETMLTCGLARIRASTDLVTSLRDSKKKTIQDDTIRHDSRSDTDELIVQIFSIKSFSLSRRNNGCCIEQARESFNPEVCRARNVRECFFEDITTTNEASPRSISLVVLKL